ncbi:uncharacterized protein LOC122258035 isoform X1 [Penaeus japonicus]|uniref:uncharacterized protein LOC122258035 isoform X1 n=1 Tax=Penaeus japonicus TaxID=27405 RepID=UPI001C70C54F|nr:uncharacterized protein LOC122258035 isoform X1 [Penaeus japonicus]
MLKFLFFAALLGSALAEGVTQQDEIYIVAGVLGGVCLLLTIACIYNTITIIGLQSKVAVLQAAGTAAVKAVTEAPPPRGEAPRRDPSRDKPYYTEPKGRDDFSRNTRPEDPYRRPPSRENYRMDRMDRPERYMGRNSYYDAYYSSGNNGGPAAPSRPHRSDDHRAAGYY